MYDPSLSEMRFEQYMQRTYGYSNNYGDHSPVTAQIESKNLPKSPSERRAAKVARASASAHRRKLAHQRRRERLAKMVPSFEQVWNICQHFHSQRVQERVYIATVEGFKVEYKAAMRKPKTAAGRSVVRTAFLWRTLLLNFSCARDTLIESTGKLIGDFFRSIIKTE